MKTAFAFLTLLIISALSVEAGKKKKCRCKDNKAKIATLQEEMSDQKKKWTQQEEINAETAEKLSKEKAEIEALKTTVENLAILVNETCPCKQPPPPKASSCQELKERDPLAVSGAYTLLVNSQEIPVYCHMGIKGCGEGGWTTAMKIDGNKQTFHFDSKMWSNKETSNLPGGETGFDTQETKLPTYWNTSFSKICLGMKIDQQINFVVLHQQASSLYSLIADGQYRATSLGRDTWKDLIGSSASLQPNCNKEGFNSMSDNIDIGKARIGYLGNNENDCGTCDSRIGFGTGGLHDNSNTCGNEAAAGDNGEKHIKAMGYILVQ